MATCNTAIDSFVSEDGTLDVVSKFNLLMQATLGEDSLYTRTKETYLELFEKYDISTPERAKIVSDNMAQLADTMSSAAMQTALAWAKEERDGDYTLAKVKAETEKLLAEFEKTKSEICVLDKTAELECAKVTATSAGSIRDNGRVATYADDGCSVATLQDEGLKYEQVLQVEAAKYQLMSDSFRKSGVVQIGTDLDGIIKGLSGDDDGFTWQQSRNAERQRIAYEDSKLNHAANSSASMIGQMLSAEIAPNESDVQRWRDSVDGLLVKHSSTDNL